MSIVVPVFNEEENILLLGREVAAALAGGKWTYELVFVDDASTDGTWERIGEAHRADPRVRGLRHQRQSGQSAAIWTGIQATTSPFIATMDGDRQNDPADYPRMLQELNDCDLVCGVRTKRQDSFRRKVSASIARKARRWVLQVDFADTGCGLRVFRRSIVKNLLSFNGFHRFLPVLVHAVGGRTKEVPVGHRPRVAGHSKYGIWNRLGRGIVDLFAIAWYQRRRLAPVPFEVLSEQEPTSAEPRRQESVTVASPVATKAVGVGSGRSTGD